MTSAAYSPASATYGHLLSKTMFESFAGSSMITCDQLLLLKTLADRATAPSSAAMSAAADALGSSYESTLSYRTTLGPGRRDGASVTRLIRFEAGCSCWVYAGPGPTAS